LLVLLCALYMAAAIQAQTPPRPKSGQKAPAAKQGKEEEMGEIEGTEIARPDGTFLGLTLVDGKFKLTFYNDKKKPMPVNVLRAVARWPNIHGPGQNRAVLNVAGDGTFLMSPQFV